MQRILELIIIGFAALVAAIPMAITAVIVAAALGRPLFFRQRRAGLGGAPFSILKFRSMTDARDATGALLSDAERTPAIARILRRTRLDELPQLLAILRGDMALVGPRPLLPETIEALGDTGRRRCTVRPGMTGWAQISGNTELTHEEKVVLDIWYIDHRSFLFDLRIMAETVWVLIRGERRREDRLAAAKAHLAATPPAAPSAAEDGAPAPQAASL